MIIFVGDFIFLRESRTWSEVVDIVPDTPQGTCILQSGERVNATDDFIMEVKSNSEFHSQV